MGIVSFGEAVVADVSGGMTGTVSIPGFHQYGCTIPVQCVLDTICVTVGSPALTTAPAQTIHAFAMLATAEGSSQVFTLHPDTKAEVVFAEGTRYRAQVQTARATGLGFALAAEMRCIVVCGHYTEGDMGSTSLTFTYSGTLLFK